MARMPAESRQRGWKRAGLTQKKRARTLAGQKFKTRRDAYIAGFQAGYQARIRFEHQHKEAA